MITVTGETKSYDDLDWAERACNIGMPNELVMFVTADRLRRETLPKLPPAAVRGEDECRCPSCKSEGMYTASVLCRYWRRFCEDCNGRREYVDHATRRTVPCKACREAWRDDVRFLLAVARSPRATITKVRNGVDI
jgi:hypothetical protein